MSTYQALEFTGRPDQPWRWVAQPRPDAGTLAPDEVLVQVQYSRINHKD